MSKSYLRETAGEWFGSLSVSDDPVGVDESVRLKYQTEDTQTRR
jgi:hypothetical protein